MCNPLHLATVGLNKYLLLLPEQYFSFIWGFITVEASEGEQS